MAYGSSGYHIAGIRKLLITAFTAEELRRFCLDCTVLQPIATRFGPADNLEQMVDEIMDFCRTRLLWNELLAEVTVARPRQYARFEHELGAPTLEESPTGPYRVATLRSDTIEGTAAATHATPNPFCDRGRINHPMRFFNRERQLREFRQMLAAGNSISLMGESQIGKSSLFYLLYRTQHEWLPDATVLYIDLQLLLGEEDFFTEILQRLNHQPGDLRTVRSVLRTGRTVLLLDEVEKLAKPSYSSELHDVLRALAQEDTLTLAVASQRPLRQVLPSRDPTSPFYNIFTQRTLGPFSPREASGFLATRLARTGVIFMPEEIEQLVFESGGHPARLQQMAHDVFETKVSHN